MLRNINKFNTSVSKGPRNVSGTITRNRNNGKKMALVWYEKSQSHCFADEFGIPYTHSLGRDTQHGCSQGNGRTMLSIINKAWKTTSVMEILIKLYSLHESLAL